MHLLQPALIYFAFVFSTGFVLGTMRVLLLLPRLGTRMAELLEMPFMLIAIVLAAGWVNQRFDRTQPAKLGIGVIALALLLLAEIAVGVGLRGTSITGALFDKDPVSGSVYYVMLGMFALMPWLLTRD